MNSTARESPATGSIAAAHADVQRVAADLATAPDLQLAPYPERAVAHVSRTKQRRLARDAPAKVAA